LAGNIAVVTGSPAPWVDALVSCCGITAVFTVVKYTIHRYVTSTNIVVAIQQQVFWSADHKEIANNDPQKSTDRGRRICGLDGGGTPGGGAQE
jgi:hypothetical protein